MQSFCLTNCLLLTFVVTGCRVVPIASFTSTGVFRQQPQHRLRLSTTTTTTVLKALEVEATWEVIGGSGRMGSLFLREHGAIAVPRGVRPGCLSSSSNNSTNKATLAAAAADDDDDDEHVITKVLTETQTIAIIGASRNAQRPSNSVMQFLLDEGYTYVLFYGRVAVTHTKVIFVLLLGYLNLFSLSLSLSLSL